ncbi:unnamed protein product [Enterobius vermicularis]|uniref:guanylate cyclase n=1 Tax=Enterobius vermicularis TaxID=51028 RepID=A0A158Q952_ENTVE|nr:unnamed protein product [Enterobius vermicularis]
MIATTIQGYQVRIGVVFPVTTEVLTYQTGFAESAGAIPIAIERLQSQNVLPGAEFSLGLSLYALLLEFHWDTLALIYAPDKANKCETIIEEVTSALAKVPSKLTIAARERLTRVSEEILLRVLRTVNQRARVIAVCFLVDENKRKFLLAAHKLNMDTEDYVYIHLENRFLGFASPYRGDKVPFYLYDNETAASEKNVNTTYAALRSFVLDFQAGGDFDVEEFGNEVLQSIRGWPFYCSAICDDAFGKGSIYARNLYDTIVVYGYALNKTITKHSVSAVNNGLLILENVPGIYQTAENREIRMNGNGIWDPVVALTGLDAEGKPRSFITIRFAEYNFTVQKNYINEATSIWATRGGIRPKSVPDCGFAGNMCSAPIFKQYIGLFAPTIALGCFLLISLMAASVCFIRNKRREREELNKRWQIDFNELVEVSLKSTSLGASHSQSVLSNRQLKECRDTASNLKSANYCLYQYSDTLVVGRKYRNVPQIDLSDEAEMRVDNIRNAKLNVDSFFMMCLIKDIINVSYINVFFATFYVLLDMLFMAPEILRDNSQLGTQSGDMYSFAVVASEILTRKPAWDLDNREQTVEEILYLLKRGQEPFLRPELNIDKDIELNSVMLHLIGDCWQENYEARPDAETIKRLLRSMRRGRSKDLMEHVSSLMEKQAAALEEEILIRTNALAEEKKKSDEVLKKMLPPRVAECLKLGEVLQPESYECATIFLSDVVSFTKLASKCTPLQVISLLDSLYMTTDMAIKNYDIFKVETIGDAYLCVSGVPERNGNRHAKEIADMALDVIRATGKIRINHLPEEKICLRVGIHSGDISYALDYLQKAYENSGPVVAGVVGAIMPRYCIFGDSMTVTSKLESSGKANNIHISSATYDLLNNQIGGYVIEKRGEVLLKAS